MPEPTGYNQRLAGKAAIVTGAGAEDEDIGIGRAIAVMLAGEGAKVACIDLDIARSEGTAARIRRAGGEAFAMAGDVSRTDDCRRFVDAAAARYGRVDILVNNVGISSPTQLVTIDEATWDRILDVNLKSAMLMSKFAVPCMIAGGGGAIVNISSIAGIRAHGGLAYGTSKAAMAQLAREIAALHGRDGIRANSVAPGHVMTPHAMHVLPPGLREIRRKVGPLGIEGDAWDVAHAVVFLVSDEARFITGVQLAVDGGVSEVGPMFAYGLITGE
jgi:NAD(P)-dependent dehydrogenase (short-subunit alcohol dehydrogenase family)